MEMIKLSIKNDGKRYNIKYPITFNEKKNQIETQKLSFLKKIFLKIVKKIRKESWQDRIVTSIKNAVREAIRKNMKEYPQSTYEKTISSSINKINQTIGNIKDITERDLQTIVDHVNKEMKDLTENNDNEQRLNENEEQEFFSFRDPNFILENSARKQPHISDNRYPLNKKPSLFQERSKIEKSSITKQTKEKIDASPTLLPSSTKNQEEIMKGQSIKQKETNIVEKKEIAETLNKEKQSEKEKIPSKQKDVFTRGKRKMEKRTKELAEKIGLANKEEKVKEKKHSSIKNQEEIIKGQNIEQKETNIVEKKEIAETLNKEKQSEKEKIPSKQKDIFTRGKHKLEKRTKELAEKIGLANKEEKVKEEKHSSTKRNLLERATHKVKKRTINLIKKKTNKEEPIVEEENDNEEDEFVGEELADLDSLPLDHPERNPVIRKIITEANETMRKDREERKKQKNVS